LVNDAAAARLITDRRKSVAFLNIGTAGLD
jgi:hypothetical protein